ncbi:glycosyltransferase [Halomicrobium mukohataei]|uniref:Glycosyltransferase n=1 Tax=Halomicrobium mukohataei TaxID=57705 RepID=A0A847TWT8_9EURY|nr:glycosyltransferase [Halomicrobium mukohataei]NLV10502.1 glycosyltransferase [Halomicrobium mukohataei]
MNVLHVHTRSVGGGGAQVVSDLHSRLNKRTNINSKLVVKEKGDEQDDVVEMKGGFLDRGFTHLIERKAGLEGFGSFDSLKLPSLIRDHNTDIVHLHNIHGYYFNIFILRHIPDQVNLLWTFHDMWPITGNCTYAMGCERYQTRCGSCPQLDEYPELPFDTTPLLHRIKMRLFNQDIPVVTPSRWLGRHVAESRLNKPNIRYIPNGVDTEKFSPVDKCEARDIFDIGTDDFVLSFIASNPGDPRKGSKYVIEALNSVSQNHDVTLLTLGSEGFPNEMLNDSIDVRIPGYIPDEKVPYAYAAGDVCIVPSLADNCPLVPLEAMACGTPVIAFDVGGLSEQVTEGTGWLVPPHDTQALRDAILTAIERFPDSKMNNAARKRVVEKYEITQCVTQYQDLYNKILK